MQWNEKTGGWMSPAEPIDVNRHAISEHHEVKRRRIYKAGAIEFSGSSVPCIVRLISTLDATLEVTSPLWFPDRFILCVTGIGLRTNCRIIWRMEKKIGVLFERDLASGG